MNNYLQMWSECLESNNTEVLYTDRKPYFPGDKGFLERDNDHRA